MSRSRIAGQPACSSAAVQFSSVAGAKIPQRLLGELVPIIYGDGIKRTGPKPRNTVRPVERVPSLCA